MKPWMCAFIVLGCNPSDPFTTWSADRFPNQVDSDATVTVDGDNDATVAVDAALDVAPDAGTGAGGAPEMGSGGASAGGRSIGGKPSTGGTIVGSGGAVVDSGSVIGSGGADSGVPEKACKPNTSQCSSPQTMQVCNVFGSAWGGDVPCGPCPSPYVPCCWGDSCNCVSSDAVCVHQ